MKTGVILIIFVSYASWAIADSQHANKDPLIKSIEIGDISLLEDMSNINDKITRYGQTPLHLAASTGQTAVVEYLLERKANINAYLNSGQTALDLAIENHHNDIVKILLSAGSSPHRKNPHFKGTAVHIAATYNNSPALIELVKSGGSLTAKNGDGLSPFHIACIKGNTQMIQLMLRFGAKINDESFTKEPVLYLAIKYKQDDTAALLVSSGAQISWKKNRDTYLHLAARNNLVKTVDALIDRSISLNDRNDKGFTALHIAAKYNFEEVARSLMKAKIDSTIKSGYSKTALHIAMEEESNAVAKIIITMANTIEENSLYIAIKQKNLEMARFIIDNGADLTMRMKNDETFLHLATEENFEAIIEKLIDAGISIDAQNDSGEAALHKALLYGNDSIARILITKNADIYLPKKTAHGKDNGPSPLDIVQRKKKKDLLDFIQEIRIKAKSAYK